MTISENEEELFKEWTKTRTPFVRDGVVSEQDYLKSCPRIAFILKETNAPGFNDLRKFLQGGGKRQSWDNVARWVHGIRNLPSECDWSFYENVNESFRREELRGIVVVNLKKCPGGSSSHYATLKKVATEDAPHIREQFAIYDPDITVCGGTGGLFHDGVHPGIDWRQTARGICWYRRNADKFVVAFPHPEARVQDSLLLFTLLDAIKEIRNNRDQGCLGG